MVRARRSIQEFGRSAAAIPSGIETNSAISSAEMPSIMVTGRRSAMIGKTGCLRKNDAEITADRLAGRAAQCAESLAPTVEGFNQTARLCRFAPRPTKDRAAPLRLDQAMVG